MKRGHGVFLKRRGIRKKKGGEGAFFGLGFKNVGS